MGALGGRQITPDTTAPSYFGYLVDNEKGRHFKLKDNDVVIVEPVTASHLGQLERVMNSWEQISRKEFRDLMKRFVWDYREGRL